MQNSIVNPIHFENIETMNRWIAKQNNEILKICREHNVTDINLDPLIIDEINLVVGLKSLGTYQKGSDRHRVIDAIQNLFK